MIPFCTVCRCAQLVRYPKSASMKNLLLFLFLFTADSLFGQKPIKGTLGLLLLEETQGHVYEAYFLPNIESQHFKSQKGIDTVIGFTVQFIYGCVPNNHELRNDLWNMKVLDSVQVISSFVSSQGHEFFDSSKIFSQMEGLKTPI